MSAHDPHPPGTGIETPGGPLPTAFSRELVRGMTAACVDGAPMTDEEHRARRDAAFEALMAFNPAEPVEAMIAAQAVAAHAATMESFRNAMRRCHTEEVIVRLRSNAAGLMRTMALSLRALERHRASATDRKIGFG
jgi:hypothetical protein